MSFPRAISSRIGGLAVVLALACGATARGQVVINELVKEERTAGAGAVSPDAREFVELYNAGATAVDIGNWTLVNDTGTPITDTIPAGSSIPAGGYFVIAAEGRGIANADYYVQGLAPTDELYPDLVGGVMQLFDASSNLVDAVAYDVFRGTPALPTNQTAGGWWGQLQSYNTTTPQSLARYRDGRDTNNNGRDFGILPLTPGASNELPHSASHAIPDVDGLAVGAELPQYHFAFINARAIDPGVANSFNPKAIPASPQGGKAIVAWDESGGGNAVYSRETVESFDLYAYLDTNPINLPGAEEWDTSTYGIGTTNGLFNNPDTRGVINGVGTSPGNGNTGVGWLFQRFEDSTNGGVNDFIRLQLVDFNDGGNSDGTQDWTVIQDIDLKGAPAGWHRLGIDVDPATGAVTARFDDQTFNFTTNSDLIGTFYVGYREAITGSVSANLAKHAPPIFDLVATQVADDADFDGDGDVDGADFLTWQRHLNATGQTNNDNGDANHDGSVNAADLGVWRAQFGSSPAGAVAAAVPEPAAGLLLAAAAAAGFAARRR
ncbi:MAG: hypothetical protein DCC67_05595 [Planctomycetota bacterium]|nr:MAG: hypothetical protein DCC67_05595 [Planctomycetota bacterium]